MKKRFFRMAVIMTALTTALAFSSCGEEDPIEDDGNKQEQVDDNNNGDDNESKPNYAFKSNKIAVEAGKTYVYSMDQKNVDGEFTVTAATAGSVTFTINGKSVTLSDAGASYLSINFEEINQTTAAKDPSQVLFCLLNKSTNISSATNAAKTEIASKAENIFFDVKE